MALQCQKWSILVYKYLELYDYHAHMEAHEDVLMDV